MAIIIGLDAGHGGSSSGTYSIDSKKDGLFEEHYTLDLCKRVSERLVEHGFKTVLTRTTDTNPGDTSKRARMLIEAKCNFCLSIHFNGFENESANGCEVFVPYGEKGAGIEAGFQKYLGEIFALRKPFARSNNYYNRNNVLDKKLNVSTRKFEALSTDKDYFGFIRTCWENGVSADLLEVCFLTNRKDFDAYTKNVDRVADAIARSICEGYKVEWLPKLPETPKEPAEEKGRFRVVAGSYDFRSNAEARKKELEAAGFTAWILEGE